MKSSNGKKPGPESKQIHDKGMRLSTKYLEDNYISPLPTKKLRVESVLNAFDDLSATVLSSRVIQQINQSNPCSMSSAAIHDRTTLYAQGTVSDMSKSEPVLEPEKEFILQDTF